MDTIEASSWRNVRAIYHDLSLIFAYYAGYRSITMFVGALAFATISGTNISISAARRA